MRSHDFLSVALVVAGVLSSSCGSGSPTAPTPTPPPVAVIAVPPVTPDPLLTDPRFSLPFYRQFVRNAFEAPTAMRPLRRQTEAPRIYLRTVNDENAPIDAVTLRETAAALINVTGQLTGRFGLAGLEQGTDTREGQAGWITVRWSALRETVCGRAAVGGDLITFYPVVNGCRCAGNASAIKPLIVKHEMGHALGYWHTDSVTDLMHSGGNTACDMEPSERERFHAIVAYSRPVGSLDP